MEPVDIRFGDSLELIKDVDDNTFDSIVTDPPYEINFINQKWDNSGIAYNVDFWSECLRVLKPGGHLLSFSASRTYHRIAVAIEDAGFEIRDSLHWIYGSGFPKSISLGTRFDEGTEMHEKWKGWGTTLKPAHEPIVMARKPISVPVYKNVEKWGVGAINIDDTRVGDDEIKIQVYNNFGGFADRERVEGIGPEDKVVTGRFPANILFSHDVNCTQEQCEDTCPVPILKQQYAGAEDFFYTTFWDTLLDTPCFKYGVKASKSEKNAGGIKNTHPTVKPVELMRYLIRLVTPPQGRVFDPFLGSGTTALAAKLEKQNVTGFELTEEYFDIITSRLADLEKND
jgi:DNA modification methylase